MSGGLIFFVILTPCIASIVKTGCAASGRRSEQVYALSMISYDCSVWLADWNDKTQEKHPLNDVACDGLEDINNYFEAG